MASTPLYAVPAADQPLGLATLFDESGQRLGDVRLGIETGSQWLNAPVKWLHLHPHDYDLFIAFVGGIEALDPDRDPDYRKSMN